MSLVWLRPFTFYNKISLALFFITLPFVGLSQEIGSLEFSGTAKKDGKNLGGVTVTIYKNSIKNKVYTSNKNGKFNFELEYGSNYTIRYNYPGCKEMNMQVYAKIPKEKYELITFYKITVLFYDTTDTRVDLKKYDHPFTKVYFDGNNLFVDDERYLEDFLKGLFTLEDSVQVIPKVPEKVIRKDYVILGKLLDETGNKKPLSFTKVYLLDENGLTMQTAMTNSYGTFIFSNLTPIKNYIIKLETSDPKLASVGKLVLTNKKGEIIAASQKGTFSNFQFSIPQNDTTGVYMKEDDKSLTIGGNLLTGENPTVPFANKKISIRNEKGEVIQSTVTNAFGTFIFPNASFDQYAVLTLDDAESSLAAGTRVSITNKTGKEITVTTTDMNGKFRFSFLDAEINKLSLLAIEESDLRMDLKGRILAGDRSMRPLMNIKINLMNNAAQVVQSAKTDKEGAFSFAALPTDEEFLISFEKDDSTLLAIGKIFLTDPAGNVIKEILFDRKAKFFFSLLPSEQKRLEEVYIEDPWMKVLKPSAEESKKDIVITELVYFNVNEWGLLPEAEKTLDKVIDIMKKNPQISIELGSHTDSQGTDKYNKELSEKRAKSAVDYMIAAGISNKRLKGKGFGESHLVNKCTDNIKCPDDEHAKNRRIEFKVITK